MPYQPEPWRSETHLYDQAGNLVEVPEDYDGHNPPLFDAAGEHANPVENMRDIEMPADHQTVVWVPNAQRTALVRKVV